MSSADKRGRGIATFTASAIGLALGGPQGAALATGLTRIGFKYDDKIDEQQKQAIIELSQKFEVKQKEEKAIPALLYIKENNGNLVRVLVQSDSVYFKSPILNAIQTFRLYVQKSLVGEINQQLKTAVYLLIDWLIAVFGFDAVMEENLITFSSKTYYPFNKKFALKTVMLSLLAIGLISAIFYVVNNGGAKDA